jgi:predicted DNA-binding protein with PD1-like motif
VRFQQFGDRYIVRLESGEPLIESLTAFLREQGVDFANLSAAGAVQWVRLAYWNAETKAYEQHEFPEQLEVVSFQGNSSLKDGAPFLHLHGVFGRRDFSVIGGHIKEARVHPTLEVWLRAESIPVCRVRDQASGLDLLDLPERPDQAPRRSSAEPSEAQAQRAALPS